jgi:signal transduction histidine kinase
MKQGTFFFRSLQLKFMRPYALVALIAICCIGQLIYNIATGFVLMAHQRLLLGIVFSLPLCMCICCIFLYSCLRDKLTIRLHDLMIATDHWSRGEFSFAVQDESSDALTELIYHFNGMAQRLQILFIEQQGRTALEERNRLARDLHDGVKQQFYALGAQIQIAQELYLQPYRVQTHLQEATLLLQSIQEEMNNLILHLRPTVLAEKGLKSAIQDHLQSWSRLHNVSIIFIPELQGNNGIVSLEQKQEEALFRVMQEALSNVARHSSARYVEVRLCCNSQETILSIADNGCGFDPERAVSGVGRHSMRERLQALGGTVEISSAPGQGTTVIASLKQTRKTDQLAPIQQPLVLEHTTTY